MEGAADFTPEPTSEPPASRLFHVRGVQIQSDY